MTERRRVPAGVLTPVVRRRQRRSARLVAVLALVLVAAAVTAIVKKRHPLHGAPVAPAVQPRPRIIDEQRRPSHDRTALIVGPPRVRRRLRPPITARAGIVVDGNSGRVLWALRAHRSLAIASTTKIMTAVVALERIAPNDVVVVPPNVLRVPLVKEGLRPREHVRAWKLFDGLLIYSGNDDALTLAVQAAGTRRAFVALMNAKAVELGLRDSHFSTPSGVIDEGNRSSAWDLAVLTRVALRMPRFRRIVRTRLARVPWPAPTFEKVYVNKNPLLGSYRGANGVKTGWTTLAGHCIVASATRNGRTIIAVLLHDRNMFVDAERLLDLGFATRD